MNKITKNTIISEVGDFPKLRETYRSDFPEGKIILKHGEHRGPGRGFGIAHILAEHESDLDHHSLPNSEDGVISYIKLILHSGALIYSEFEGIGRPHRPTIIRSSIGTVVLERQEINGETLYSVVTAFGGKSAKGTQIGTF